MHIQHQMIVPHHIKNISIELKSLDCSLWVGRDKTL